ncbi:hypothetical protein [Macellibacteroides fermentans]|uniref:hypothetical protein n=1 Tax=Macellibacteroides fermentans TaxID=879969 RepID=UPI002B39DE61|nr:hypothetical protein [Macellibacteroides fermentans]
MRTSRGMSDLIRMQIIQERLSGASYSSLRRKYNLNTGDIIKRWMRIFGIMDNQKKRSQPLSVVDPLNESIEDPTLLKQALKEAICRAEKAELRSKAFETMIEVAEAKYKIAIRKKHGTRQ